MSQDSELTSSTSTLQSFGFQSVFDAAPVGLCVLDLGFRYVMVNDFFANMYGMEKSLFIGHTVEQALPGPATQIVAHLHHALTADTLVEREIVLHNPRAQADKEGLDEVIYLRTAQPLRNDEGVTTGVVVALLDITGRKRAEQRFREIAEDLKYTVELTPHIPWTANSSGKLTFVSPRWNTITGTTEPLRDWADALYPEDLVASTTAWRHSVQEGEPYDAEFRVRSAQGGWRWVRARAYPRVLESGEIIRWYGTLEDIHERKVIAMQLLEATEQLSRRALEDHLTGLANRRRFDEVFRNEIDRARRTGNPMALLLVDIDHFKQFNDIAGHLMGDECLRSVAKAIQKVIRRPADLAARFGGEEFAILLAETEQEGAVTIATRILEAVRDLRFVQEDVRVQRVTVSIGVAAHHSGDYGPTETVVTDLIQSADDALYQAKASGRNCLMEGLTV